MADEEFMFGDLFATVRVQDLPASREVVAVERQENGTWRVCGSAIANTDGIAELGIEGSKASRVYAFAIDHWGEPFTPNRTVAYGDIIRPSVFLGWLYRVTAPGVLPGEEPVWWNSTPGMPRPVGSAMAQAEMYFQPIAHGPVDIEWDDKEKGDPHWDKVVSLLHFDGADGSTTFDDDAGRSWTAAGTAQIDTAQAGAFGGASGLFDGAGARITTPGSADFAFGTGDFTIEMRVRQASPVSQWRELFMVNARSGLNIMLFDGKLAVGLEGIANDYTAPAPVALGGWYHLAISRAAGVVYGFVNGTLAFSGAFGHNFSQLATVSIGAKSNGISAFAGHIDELRVTKGVARYTANFTPPTEPFPNFK